MPSAYHLPGASPLTPAAGPDVASTPGAREIRACQRRQSVTRRSRTTTACQSRGVRTHRQWRRLQRKRNRTARSGLSAMETEWPKSLAGSSRASRPWRRHREPLGHETPCSSRTHLWLGFGAVSRVMSSEALRTEHGPNETEQSEAHSDCTNHQPSEPSGDDADDRHHDCDQPTARRSKR